MHAAGEQERTPIRAAVYQEAGQPLTIETIPDPVPAEDEVVIAVRGAGICGSDLHITQHAGITRPGTVLGHEFAGTIAALGAGVAGGWKVGDRVTALPLFPCCACEACDAHMPNLCSHGNAKLCEGFVEGHNVECPFHQAMFNLRDGSVSCGPATEPVKSWPVKIENGRVLLKLDQ